MKLLIIVVLFFLSASCGWNGKQEYRDILRPVRVMGIGTPGTSDKIYSGVVGADEYSDLSFTVGGPLVEMNVDAGQLVKKGTLIARVDASDYQLRYDADRAAYVTARSQLERNKRLLEMEAVSVQEYEVSEANFVRAQSAYEASAKALADTRLLAPFDGFVEKKYVENYQKVQPGQPVVKLVNPDKLAVWFILPETSVGLTRERMHATVEFDIYRGVRFRARVGEFVDASPGGGGIPVRLIVDDSLFDKYSYPVYPGFSVRVNLRTDEGYSSGDYVVPLNAVFIDPLTGHTSVWLYLPSSSTVSRLPVRLGSLFGNDKVLVTDGLQEGDILVVDGVNFITEGQKVKVLENNLY